MARPLRIEYEVYHVTARGNELRKVYFSQERDEREQEAQKKGCGN